MGPVKKNTLSFTTNDKNAVFAYDYSPDKLEAFDMVALTTAPRQRRNEALSSLNLGKELQRDLQRDLQKESEQKDQKMHAQVEKQVGVLFDSDEDILDNI